MTTRSVLVSDAVARAIETRQQALSVADAELRGMLNLLLLDEGITVPARFVGVVADSSANRRVVFDVEEDPGEERG